MFAAEFRRVYRVPPRGNSVPGGRPKAGSLSSRGPASLCPGPSWPRSRRFSGNRMKGNWSNALTHVGRLSLAEPVPNQPKARPITVDAPPPRQRAVLGRRRIQTPARLSSENYAPGRAPAKSSTDAQPRASASEIFSSGNLLPTSDRITPRARKQAAGGKCPCRRTFMSSAWKLGTPSACPPLGYPQGPISETSPGSAASRLRPCGGSRLSTGTLLAIYPLQSRM